MRIKSEFIKIKHIMTIDNGYEFTVEFPGMTIMVREDLYQHKTEYFVKSGGGDVVQINENDYSLLIKKWKMIKWILEKIEGIGENDHGTMFKIHPSLKEIGAILRYDEEA